MKVMSESSKLCARSMLLGLALAAGAGLAVSGCATEGKDFPVGRVMEIQIGKTTINDIQAMFGQPYRVGSESGVKTWSYGKYRWNLFGPGSNQDLVVRFDSNNVVKSYTFNTTTNK